MLLKTTEDKLLVDFGLGIFKLLHNHWGSNQ